MSGRVPDGLLARLVADGAAAWDPDDTAVDATTSPRALPDPSARCGARCGARAAVELAGFAVGVLIAWRWLR